MTSQASTVAVNKLECSICLEPFEKPKFLPCYHTFCEVCLEGLAANVPVSESFKCPTCRMDVTVPVDGISSFQNNFYIAEDLEDERRARDSEKCALHNDGQLTLVCKDCDVLICQQCKTTRHTQHRTVLFAKEIADAKEELRRILKDLEGRGSAVKNALSRMPTNERATKKKIDKIQKDIRKKTKVWFTKIAKARVRALKIIDDFATNRQAKLDQSILRTQKDRQKTTALLEQTRHALHHERGATVLSILDKIKADMSGQKSESALTGDLMESSAPPEIKMDERLVEEVDQVLGNMMKEGLIDMSGPIRSSACLSSIWGTDDDDDDAAEPLMA